MKAVRISPAEISRAKEAAEEAGLRLVGLEKRPDGTVKFEFGEYERGDFWDGSPLFGEQRQ